MNIIEKSLSQIKPYEKNPRKNDEAVKYVAESIKEFGFKVPIVIDKKGVIICGHTRYKAAQTLGLKTVPCIVADDLTPKQIKAYRIADNKVSDYSIWDNKILLEELGDLADIFTGFDIGTLDFDVFNEKENAVVENNEYGTQWEIVFKSSDKSKIDKIKELWEGLDGESFNS